MNNFELDRQAKQLADTNSAYNLARRVISLEIDLDRQRSEQYAISSDIEGLHQRSNAWARVVDLLNNLDPRWRDKNGSAVDCALASIKKMSKFGGV